MEEVDRRLEQIQESVKRKRLEKERERERRY